jgi:hypothetical protein
MRRPLYESQEDLANEKATIDRLAAHWRCVAVKLPIRYELDYGLCRNGDLMAWAEVKCRKVPREKYPTYMVSLGKVLAGLELAERTNLPFLLIVQWTDALGWIQPSARAVQMGGRRDRADCADVEPVVHIPIKDFKLICPTTY